MSDIKLIADEGRLLGPEDQQKAINRARQRAEAKIEEREHLRLELRAREYIQVCHKGIDMLLDGHETLGEGVPGGGQRVPLDRSRVQAIKAAMDTSLRLLDRVLPPLKAVEIQDSPEKEANVQRLTTTELMELMARFQRREQRVVAEQEKDPLPWK